MSRKINKSKMINILLASILVLVLVFGYLYFRKLNPVEVIKANVPVPDIPAYTYAFAIYGGDTPIRNPYKMVVFNDAVYISDTANRRIVVTDLTGQFRREIKDKNLKMPTGMAVDGPNLYVGDGSNENVKVMDANGNITRTIQLAKDTNAAGITVDNGILYVLNNRLMQVQKYDLNSGKLVKSFGSNGNGTGQLYYPYDIAVRNGQIYISDSLNNRISVFGLEGNFKKYLPDPKTKSGVATPRGLAFDRDGRLYIAEGVNGDIKGINQNGEVDLLVSGGETIQGQVVQISLPTDVAIDNLDRLYVLEHANGRVLVYKRD